MMRRFSSRVGTPICALASNNVALKHLLERHNATIFKSFLSVFFEEYATVPNIDVNKIVNLTSGTLLDKVTFKHPVLVQVNSNYGSMIDISPFAKIDGIEDYLISKYSLADESTNEVNLYSLQFMTYKDIYHERKAYTKDEVKMTLTSTLSGRVPADVKLIIVDLVKAKKYLSTKEKLFSSYDDYDWWLELLTNSDNYENNPTIYADKPVPKFFEHAINQLDMGTWPATLKNKYEDDMKLFKLALHK